MEGVALSKCDESTLIHGAETSLPRSHERHYTLCLSYERSTDPEEIHMHAPYMKMKEYMAIVY
jgi:hypothetical protein